MIYTVTLNPSLDYIVDVEEFHMNALNRSRGERILPGGKGLNVSMVLNNLGQENIAYGICGGFTGTKLCGLLNECGVCTDFVWTQGGMTRVNVKVRSKGETEINGRGPKIAENELEELLGKLDKLKKEDVLVLSGSVPPNVSSTVYLQIMERVAKQQVRVVVDAESNLLTNALQYRPFLIKPNKYELEQIFEKDLEDSEAVAECALELQKRGACNVLVSMGGEGAILVTEQEEIFYANAPKGEAVNTVGAGDSMLAGFLAGYLQNQDYEEALLMGMGAGSASAFSEELATKDEVEQLLSENKYLITNREQR